LKISTDVILKISKKCTNRNHENRNTTTPKWHTSRIILLQRLDQVQSDAPDLDTCTPFRKEKMKTANNEDDEFYGSSGEGSSLGGGQPGAVQVIVSQVGEKKKDEDEDQTSSSRSRSGTKECGTIRSSSVSPTKESAVDPDVENEDSDVVHPSCSSSLRLLQERGNNSHEKRRSLGRSARRRRRKFLDIQQREEEILRKQCNEAGGGGNNSNNTVGGTLVDTFLTKMESSASSSTSSIPVDRDKVWPAVAKQRQQRQQFAVADDDEADGDNFGGGDDGSGWRGPADERLVIGQLGFLPGNAIRVSTRVKDILRNGRQQEQQQQDGDEEDYCLGMQRLLFASSKNSHNSSSSSNNNNGNDAYGNMVLDDGDDGQVPVVLQLYPLVYRDEYTGGKADGRKVAKGRKRLLRRKDAVVVNIAAGDTDDNNENNGNKKDAASNSSQTAVEVDASLSNNNNIDKADDSVVVEPFPTIYWLTHPLLRVWISQLELDGLGVRLQQRLAAPGNEALLERMKRAHEMYALEREQLLTPADVALVQARHWDDALLLTKASSSKSSRPIRGVAGVRNFKAVKCLHAHAAHYLSVGGMGSRDNVVGEWVMQEVHKMLNERRRRENDNA
jgi:uncharacterized protein